MTPAQIGLNQPTLSAEQSGSFLIGRVEIVVFRQSQFTAASEMTSKGARGRNESAKDSSEMSGRSSTTKAKRFTDQPSENIPKLYKTHLDTKSQGETATHAFMAFSV